LADSFHLLSAEIEASVVSVKLSARESWLELKGVWLSQLNSSLRKREGNAYKYLKRSKEAPNSNVGP